MKVRSPLRSEQMSSRLPVPGPSFVKDEPIRGRDLSGAGAAPLHAGMTAPSSTDDDWWLAHLWVADGAGIVDAHDLAPVAGPPPGTPIAALGPRLAGALSGLIAEEDGRQLIRLTDAARGRRVTALGTADAPHARYPLGSGARERHVAQPACARADRRLRVSGRGPQPPVIARDFSNDLNTLAVLVRGTEGATLTD